MFIWKTGKYYSQIKAKLFKTTYPRLPSGRDRSKQLKSMKENHKIPCLDFQSPASLSTDKVLVRLSVLRCLWVPSVTVPGLLKLDRYLSIILFRVLWCGQIWPYSLPYQAWKHLLYRQKDLFMPYAASLLWPGLYHVIQPCLILCLQCL